MTHAHRRVSNAMTFYAALGLDRYFRHTVTLGESMVVKLTS